MTGRRPHRAHRLCLRPSEQAIHRRINEYDDDQPDTELLLTSSR